MIGVVLGVIAGIIIYFYLGRDGTETRSDKTFASIMTGFGAIILVEIGMLVTTSVTNYDQGIELVSTQPIVSLTDRSDLSGEYFLGCGSFASTDYYVFYAEDEHGYKRYKISAQSSNIPVYINYTSDSEQPHIDTYKTVRRLKHKNSIWFSLILYFKDFSKDVGDITDNDLYSPGRIEIFVPEGSIQENYNIDLE